MGGSASVFNRLAEGHLVVKAKCAAERIAYLTFHGYGPLLKIAVLGEHRDGVTGLKSEVRISVLSGEGDGKEFHGLVGTGALHNHIILTGSVL